MPKKELLYQIEIQELARIYDLSDSAFRKEVAEWFNDEEMPSESNSEVLNDYMTDYMRWQNDKSIEELHELLTCK